MSKQANTKLIGGFVVGAVALIVTGIILFGSSKLFTQQRKFVLFFDDSVSGLSIGAPVDFRGVKIGRVTDINVVLEKKDLSLRIPVFIEFEPERVRVDTSEKDLRELVATNGTNNFLDLLVKRGLRAQLVMQSYVTGQLGIHLDFFPEKPARLTGGESGYPEIPTVDSSLTELAKTVQNIPLAEITDRLSKILNGVEQFINSPEAKDAMLTLHATVRDLHTFVSNLDGQIKPIAKNADRTLIESHKVLENISKLAQNLDDKIPRLATVLEDTVKGAGVTLKGANKAIDGFTADNSPVRVELIKSLQEFSSAARALRVLADYLENHPEALVRGKGK